METSNSGNRPVVLASASPRRRGFLHQLGYQFEVVTPATEEKACPGESAADYVRRNAAEKARDVAGRVAPDAVVVCDDVQDRRPGPGLARGEVKQLVEGVVKLHIAVRITAFQRGLLLAEILAHQRQMPAFGLAYGLMKDRALRMIAQEHALLHRVQVDAGYAAQALGIDVHQLGFHQRHDGFADGRAADAQRLRKLRIHEHHPRGEVKRHDAVIQHAVCILPTILSGSLMRDGRLGCHGLTSLWGATPRTALRRRPP